MLQISTDRGKKNKKNKTKHSCYTRSGRASKVEQTMRRMIKKKKKFMKKTLAWDQNSNVSLPDYKFRLYLLFNCDCDCCRQQRWLPKQWRS